MKPGNALVTGGSRRIGRAIAEALAGDGWGVAVHARRPDEDARDALNTLWARGALVTADLGVEAEVVGLVGRAAQALGGPLTLLVNNASAFEHDDVRTATRESWDRHIEPNLRAPFVLMQEFAAQKDAAGVVINLLDQRVWNLTTEFVSYTVSKAGLWTLTQTMALALAPKIRVMGIGPGPVLPSTQQTAAQFAAQAAATPLGIPAALDDVIGAVRFILRTPSLTGQMIALDGGQHLQPFKRTKADS